MSSLLEYSPYKIDQIRPTVEELSSTRCIWMLQWHYGIKQRWCSPPGAVWWRMLQSVPFPFHTDSVVGRLSGHLTRSTRPYRASVLFYILHMAWSCLGIYECRMSDRVPQDFKTSEHSGKSNVWKTKQEAAQKKKSSSQDMVFLAGWLTLRALILFWKAYWH